MEIHKKSAAKSALGSEFDRFLFAPLGEDKNGLPLSVVSLLARLNLDPWQEAGSLATLPAEAAARRLAGSLETLTDPAFQQVNSRALVLRLLAKLPTGVAEPVPASAADGSAVAPPNLGLRAASIVITFTIVVLVSQIIATQRSAPTPAAVAPRTASPAVPSPIPPPAADHS